MDILSENTKVVRVRGADTDDTNRNGKAGKQEQGAKNLTNSKDGGKIPVASHHIRL